MNIFIKWKEIKFEKEEDFEIELTIHPYNNGKIIINVPGVDGSIDGYNDKYKKIAENIIKNEIGAVVRIPNPYTFGYGWEINLRQVINYCLENSKCICGTDIPEIYLMGFSAGGSAAAILAWEYPEIKKILLIEPALSIGEDLIKKSLEEYTGELIIVSANGENSLGSENGEKFMSFAKKTSRASLTVIDNCDHQFKGEKNGKIFGSAPIFAFDISKCANFPNVDDCMKLYD